MPWYAPWSIPPQNMGAPFGPYGGRYPVPQGSPLHIQSTGDGQCLPTGVSGNDGADAVFDGFTG